VGFLVILDSIMNTKLYFWRARSLNILGKFVCTKFYCNIGTIGHVDHGKTTLMVVITKCLQVIGNAIFKNKCYFDVCFVFGIFEKISFFLFNTKIRRVGVNINKKMFYFFKNYGKVL